MKTDTHIPHTVECTLDYISSSRLSSHTLRTGFQSNSAIYWLMLATSF